MVLSYAVWNPIYNFLTKPIFRLLHWLHGFIGNMGWSIIALTFILKTLVFPLARKSYISMAKMKELPTEDPVFGKGSVRADGRKMHNMYLYEVKTPAESKGAWDYYKQIAVIPAEQAFRPLAESECPLVKK